MSSAVDVRTVLKRRIKTLEKHLSGAVEGDPRSLHQARVASRRLREVLPLLPTALPKASRRVRRLTGWLGRVREMDVALDLLGSEDLAPRLSRAALAEARQQLQVRREKRREKMLRHLAEETPQKLIRMLTKLLDESADGDLDHGRRELATRLAHRTSSLARAVDQAGAIYVAERLHAVRIAAKKLRYSLEIAAELGVAQAARLAAVIRRSQVILGDLQDRYVLIREVHEAADGAAAAERKGLAALELELEAACRGLHARFLSQRESLIEALAAIRQHVVPALVPSAGRRSAKATRAAVMHGKPHRALPDSTRTGRGTRRRVA